jgi:hypothetical protein
MKIPSMLKVGGIKYEVKMVDAHEIDAECADTCYQNSVIRLIDSLPRDQKEEAFIHEIIHTLNCKIEEDTVEFLAQGIYQVFKENGMFGEEIN